MSNNVDERLNLLESNVEHVFLLVKNLDDRLIALRQNFEDADTVNYLSIDKCEDQIREIKELLSNRLFRELA